jgi:pilus assembly protein CpaC
VLSQPNLTIITMTALAIMDMNYFKALLLWAFLATTFSAHAYKTISIEMGKQRIQRYDKYFNHVAVGDPEIADITLIDEQQVLITPKKPGATSLMWWSSDETKAPDYELELLVTAKQHAVDKPDDSGLEVSGVNDKLKLSGQSASLETHDQALQSLDEKSAATVDASRLGFDSQVQIDI